MEATADGLFHSDPMALPLTYPGRIPGTSGLLVDDRFLPLDLVAERGVEEWTASFEGGPLVLAEILERLGVSRLSARHPVVAVGSNGSPSQMRRKFLNHSMRPVIPMTLADVSGIVPGVSAHVSKAGYIPAVPVELVGEISRLFVLWLDDDELDVLDQTEPNYWRRLLPAERHPVTLVSGVRLPPCFVYVGKHGHLVDGAGRPRRLRGQRDLIQDLLDQSPRLRRLCGATPESFIVRVHDPAVRDAVYQIFPVEHLVKP